MNNGIVLIQIWPFAQRCFECEFGFECQDDESGKVTGTPFQPFALCLQSESAICNNN